MKIWFKYLVVTLFLLINAIFVFTIIRKEMRESALQDWKEHFNCIEFARDNAVDSDNQSVKEDSFNQMLKSCEEGYTSYWKWHT